MDFNKNLNNLPIELRNKIFVNSLERCYLLEHKKKMKIIFPKIINRNHNVYKSIDFFKTLCNSGFFNEYNILYKQVDYIINYNHNYLYIIKNIFINYYKYIEKNKKMKRKIHIKNYYNKYKYYDYVCLKSYYEYLEIKIPLIFIIINHNINEYYYLINMKYKIKNKKIKYNKNRNKYNIKDMSI